MYDWKVNKEMKKKKTNIRKKKIFDLTDCIEWQKKFHAYLIQCHYVQLYSLIDFCCLGLMKMWINGESL